MMHPATGMAAALIFCVAGLPAQKPESTRAYDCYVQAAEARMRAAKPFLVADSDAALNDQLVRSRKIATVPGNGPNPHKAPGGMINDWIATAFIPGATLQRTLRMLQDYDNRARYFSEILFASKLLCRSGEGRFRFSMRLKEPAVTDTENDVVWEQVDQRRWRCRSYATKVQEVGKPHNYVWRLSSYWWLAEADNGVYVQTQTISLGAEFSAFMRNLGAALGISPEKSLKKTLESMRNSLLKPGLDFAKPPAGLPDCGEPYRPASCVNGGR
jgi:hypothetical protein